MPRMRNIEKKWILIVVAMLLVAIGSFYLVQDYRAREQTLILERAIDLETARARIGKLAPHGPGWSEMVCRPGMPTAVRLVELRCGGAGDILIRFESDEAGGAKADFHASSEAEYIVGGVRMRKARVALDEHVVASIRRRIEAAKAAITPLEHSGVYRVPSFPAAIEACMSGRYIAAYRNDHAFEPKFEKLWAGIHKELKAELGWAQNPRPFMCL